MDSTWIIVGVFAAVVVAFQVFRRLGQISGDRARTLVQGGCAHVASLPHVRIDGDRAIATHYTQVLAHQDDGGFRCVRLSAHRWELERGPGGWVMKHRRTALLDGNALAQELLRAHARGPGGADVPAP